MVEIIGSIDNAWKRGKVTNVHHLIFTSDSILAFDVLSKKEMRTETRNYLMSDPLTLAPVTAVQSYGVMRDSKSIHMQIIGDAISAGNEIERNIDAEIAKEPPGFQRIDNDKIESIKLRQGEHLGLPSLTIITDDGKIEYKLMHNNYEKLARLDDDTFNKYSELLTRAFADKAIIEK